MKTIEKIILVLNISGIATGVFAQGTTPPINQLAMELICHL